MVCRQTLAKPSIKAVEEGEVRFVPKHWENTYYGCEISNHGVSRDKFGGVIKFRRYGPDGEIFVEMTGEEARKAASSLWNRG